MAIFTKTADGWTEIGASGSGDCDLVGGVAGWAAIESVTGAADLQDLKDAGIAPGTATADAGCPGTYNITQDGVVWRVAVFTGDGSVSTSGGLADLFMISAGGTGAAGALDGGGGRVIKGIHHLPVNNTVTIGQTSNAAGANGLATFLGQLFTGLSGQSSGAGGISLDNTERNFGVTSSITGTPVTYGKGAETSPGANKGDGGFNKGSTRGSTGIVIVRAPKDAEQPWEPAPELPGIGGWATVTEVKGKGTKYEYGDWVAFEWTDDGSVATSGGLVDAFVLSGGSSFFQYAGADVYGNGGQHLVGLKNLDVGDNEVVIGAGGIHQYNGSRTATWGKPSSIGPVASADTFSGSGLENNIVTNDYTGSDKTYGQDSGASNAPANSGNYGTKNAGSGVVIIRVPKSSDNSGLPAGAFDEPVTLAPGLEGAGPEVPEAPEPEEGGALFSRTYTLNSDPSTEPGLVYPSTNYIKLNREDALVWQENVEDGVDILCELPPDGGYPGYRRRYFNLYYYVPQTGSSKLKFYDGYDGSIPSYVDKSYTVTAYPAGQIPDDETLDAASAQAAAVEARESVKTKRKKKK